MLRLQLPPSKSILNRRLILQAVLGGGLGPRGKDWPQDCIELHAALEQYLQKPPGQTWDLYSGEGATTFRFLTACLALKGHQGRLSAGPQMSLRPVGPLVEALNQLGAQIRYAGKQNFPPLEFSGPGLEQMKFKKTPAVQLPDAQSSQFASALGLIAPALPHGLEIRVPANMHSASYLNLTIREVRNAGVSVVEQDTGKQTRSLRFSTLEKRKLNLSAPIEPDWSAATFWMQAMLLAPLKELRLPGLQLNSPQPDRQTLALFQKLGLKAHWEQGEFIVQGNMPAAQPPNANAKKPSTLKKDIQDHPYRFKFNLSQTPDAFPALTCTLAALGIPAELSGLETLKHKESDRLQALHTELKKLGGGLQAQLNPQNPPGSSTEYRVLPLAPPSSQTVHLKTYGDHRLYMALQLLQLRGFRIQLDHPQCVTKSYPQYPEHFKNYRKN